MKGYMITLVDDLFFFRWGREKYSKGREVGDEGEGSGGEGEGRGGKGGGKRGLGTPCPPPLLKQH